MIGAPSRHGHSARPDLPRAPSSPADLQQEKVENAETDIPNSSMQAKQNEDTMVAGTTIRSGDVERISSTGGNGAQAASQQGVNIEEMEVINRGEDGTPQHSQQTPEFQLRRQSVQESQLALGSQLVQQQHKQHMTPPSREHSLEGDLQPPSPSKPPTPPPKVVHDPEGRRTSRSSCRRASASMVPSTPVQTINSAEGLAGQAENTSSRISCNVPNVPDRPPQHLESQVHMKPPLAKAAPPREHFQKPPLPPKQCKRTSTQNAPTSTTTTTTVVTAYAAAAVPIFSEATASQQAPGSRRSSVLLPPRIQTSFSPLLPSPALKAHPGRINSILRTQDSPTTPTLRVRWSASTLPSLSPAISSPVVRTDPSQLRNSPTPATVAERALAPPVNSSHHHLHDDEDTPPSSPDDDKEPYDGHFPTYFPYLSVSMPPGVGKRGSPRCQNCAFAEQTRRSSHPRSPHFPPIELELGDRHHAVAAGHYRCSKCWNEKSKSRKKGGGRKGGKSSKGRLIHRFAATVGWRRWLIIAVAVAIVTAVILGPVIGLASHFMKSSDGGGQSGSSPTGNRGGTTNNGRSGTDMGDNLTVLLSISGVRADFLQTNSTPSLANRGWFC
ncbi:hypothetical protein HK102_007942 [Quaeritorhiza haematococci]|nr:hypothetical protein HK102_007942 [Quaeritorhiza haematococci]